jgi:hypothetical protein
LNLSSIIIGCIFFIVITAGVLALPNPDAHFYNQMVEPSPDGGDYMVKMDVGLHDT